MINEQTTRFEAIAIMNKCIAKKTPSEWYLMQDGVVVGTIQKDESGYVVSSKGVTKEPFNHFSKAIASMLDNFLRCANYLKTRKIYSDAIEAMQPRVKYFAANPNNDPYVITLRAGEGSPVSVLTNEGISDFVWCDIHTAKLPKTIIMIPDFMSAKEVADKTREAVNKNLGDNVDHPFFKREISVMRFSEATAANVRYYIDQNNDLTLAIHELGLQYA